MTKFIEPNILFQYKATQHLATLLQGLRSNAISVSNEDLFKFFDLELASGAWLDQLGAYLNIPRPYITTDQTFITDQSLMDDPNYLLDGNAFADDTTYKAYIRGIIYKRNSRFTINDIINCLLYVTGPAKILVSPTVKTVDIYIGAVLEEQKRIFNLLSSFERTWFGLPTGVRLREFKVLVLPVDTDFFITDYSLMDDPNSLMV